jgi:outer membrane protein TolC
MKVMRQVIRVGVMLGICIELGGCINQTAEVNHYRKVIHAYPQPAPRKVPHLLTLSAALRMANDNNESLAIAGENYLQALIAKDRAFANFLPTIGLAPTDYQRKGFNESQFPPGFGNLFQTHYFDTSLATTLNVNILRDSVAISAAGSYSGVQKSLLLNPISLYS